MDKEAHDSIGKGKEMKQNAFIYPYSRPLMTATSNDGTAVMTRSHMEHHRGNFHMGSSTVIFINVSSDIQLEDYSGIEESKDIHSRGNHPRPKSSGSEKILHSVPFLMAPALQQSKKSSKNVHLQCRNAGEGHVGDTGFAGTATLPLEIWHEKSELPSFQGAL